MEALVKSLNRQRRILTPSQLAMVALEFEEIKAKAAEKRVGGRPEKGVAHECLCSATERLLLIPPEVLEAIRRKLRVSHSVLDVLVPEVVL
jgi:hypothetical protein